MSKGWAHARRTCSRHAGEVGSSSRSSPQRGGRGIECGGALACTGHEVRCQLHTRQAGIKRMEGDIAQHILQSVESSGVWDQRARDGRPTRREHRAVPASCHVPSPACAGWLPPSDAAPCHLLPCPACSAQPSVREQGRHGCQAGQRHTRRLSCRRRRARLPPCVPPAALCSAHLDRVGERLLCRQRLQLQQLASTLLDQRGGLGQRGEGQGRGTRGL